MICPGFLLKMRKKTGKDRLSFGLKKQLCIISAKQRKARKEKENKQMKRGIRYDFSLLALLLIPVGVSLSVVGYQLSTDF